MIGWGQILNLLIPAGGVLSKPRRSTGAESRAG